MKTPPPSKELPMKSFATQKLWRAWLQKNHTVSNGVQLRLYKKATGIKSINYQEALDEALCFGWIDGQSNKYDEQSWLQKFTPRRKRSMWSKRNREHVARLNKAKLMMPAGIEEVKRAKKDGRWDQAYDSPKNMQIPEDFLNALKKDTSAYAYFMTLNKSNVYAIAWRLQTAKKPETRERRKNKILNMLRMGTAFH
jgi:uncharacterized protein YdeI (YjbR/CyaY-like superfamily)